jgi:hypothetical protein
MFEDLKKEEDTDRSHTFKEKEVELDKENLKNNSKITNVDYNIKLSNFKKYINPIDQKKQTQTDKKSKKKFSIIRILVIFFILIGGGWFYYVQGEAILLSSQMKWDWGNQTDSFYTENNLFLKIYNLNLKNQSNDLLIVGLIPETLILNSNSSLKSLKDRGEGEINLEIDFGPIVNLDLSFKKIDQDLYLKLRLRGLKDIIPFLSIPDIDSEDRWVLLDEEFTNIPFYNFKNQEPNSLVDTFQSELEDKIPSFLEKLKDKNIFTIEDPHENLKLNSLELKKINYSFKRDKIDDFIFIIIDLMAKDDNEAYKNKEEFIQSKKDKSEEWCNLEKIIQDLKISLWIDKSNKIIGGFNLKLDNFKINTNDFETMIDFEFSNLVQDIQLTDISTPEDYMTSSKFLEDVQNSLNLNKDILMPEANFQSIEKSLDDTLDMNDYVIAEDSQDTDQDGIPDYIEKIIGTDPLNSDTDGDGYLDGEEIENGYNPLGPGRLDPELIDFYKQIIGDN